SNFAGMVHDSSIFTVSGTGAAIKVLHGLGTAGEVHVAEADSGAAFSITLSKVHDAACPSIASVMQRISDTITVASDGQAATTVKDVSTHYSALAAESYCAAGAVNTFVFTVS